MYIIGSGMSGLLAANMFSKQSPIILEKEKTIPNNHKALLRFRTNKVSQATGIPFKKVSVSKQINYKGQTFDKCLISHSNEYARKVTGEYSSRSIINLDSCDRYIAPENFIEQMAIGCNIETSMEVKTDFFRDLNTVKISTIPMYNLMEILGWEEIPKFEYKSIWTLTADINHPKTDLYQTTYYPNMDLDMYRMSITGSKVIAEFVKNPLIATKYKGALLTHEEYLNHFLANDFGIKNCTISEPKNTFQKYGKLLPISNKIRQKFISWATAKYNIYSLGRWGTHRQLLMDDVVDDCLIIKHLLNTDNYGVIKK